MEHATQIKSRIASILLAFLKKSKKKIDVFVHSGLVSYSVFNRIWLVCEGFDTRLGSVTGIDVHGRCVYLLFVIRLGKIRLEMQQKW